MGRTKMGSDKIRRKRKAITARDGFVCFYCELDFLDYPNDATFDHILPAAYGGPNRNENLIFACFWCNNERSDMPFMDYVRYVIDTLDVNAPALLGRAEIAMNRIASMEAIS